MGWWTVTEKDLGLLIQDRRALFLLVALPLVFVAILGVSTGKLFNQKKEREPVPVALVDEDGGSLARDLADSISRLSGLHVDRYDAVAEARTRLEDGKYRVLVIIGREFSTRVEQLDVGDIFAIDQGKLRSGLPALDIQVDSRSAYMQSVLAALVRENVFAMALKVIARPVLERNRAARQFIERKIRGAEEDAAAEQAAAEELVTPAGGTTPPATTTAAPADDSADDSNIVYQELVPSYTVLFAFFLVNIMAHSFIHERNLGTLKRLRMAPVAPLGLLAGKTIPFLIISLLQCGSLFLFGKLLFGMSWGPQPLLLIPVIACTSLAATTLGLLLSTIVRTEAQVSAYANFLVIVSAGISGCFLPRDWLPELMQQISLVTPHAWALMAYEQLLARQQPDLAVVSSSCAVLASYAAAYCLFGWWRFRTLD